MLRVTGPVTRRRSAWRGEATKCTPKRSLSYTGLVSPVISSSQPLQDPASTSRIASARPKRRRARSSTSWSSRTTSLPAADRGSVASPTWRILEKRRTLPASRLAAQLPQHGLRADEVAVEDPTGDREQVPKRGIANRIAHDRALLASVHDVLRPQHGELLGHRGLVDAKNLLELVHAPLAVDEDFEYSNPKGMRKGFEELCLEHLKLPNARRWLHAPHLIYEYNQTRRNEYMFLTIFKPWRRVCLSVGFT